MSQSQEYGAEVSSAPRFWPSSLNWTPATPWPAVAVATTVWIPLTEPLAGAVIATPGGVLSALTVADASFDGGLTLPAASSAATL